MHGASLARAQVDGSSSTFPILHSAFPLTAASALVEQSRMYIRPGIKERDHYKKQGVIGTSHVVTTCSLGLRRIVAETRRFLLNRRKCRRSPQKARGPCATKNPALSGTFHVVTTNCSAALCRITAETRGLLLNYPALCLSTHHRVYSSSAKSKAQSLRHRTARPREEPAPKASTGCRSVATAHTQPS